MTVEVRQPSGQLADDLLPDSILQIKIRDDPIKVQERISNDRHREMVLAISSSQNTGNILSQNIVQMGS